jgi:hypothetical protein
LGRDETLSVEGATVGGRNLWKWILIAVLVGLVGELAAVKLLRPASRPAAFGQGASSLGGASAAGGAT